MTSVKKPPPKDTTPLPCLFYPHPAWLSDFMLPVSETDRSFSFQLANALLFKQAEQQADALGDLWQGTSVAKQWLCTRDSQLPMRGPSGGHSVPPRPPD